MNSKPVKSMYEVSDKSEVIKKMQRKEKRGEGTNGRKIEGNI